jgi:hypothetical protein
MPVSIVTGNLEFDFWKVQEISLIPDKAGLLWGLPILLLKLYRSRCQCMMLTIHLHLVISLWAAKARSV